METHPDVSLDVVMAAGWIITTIIGIIAVCSSIVAGIAFWNSDVTQAKTFSLMIQRAGGLQLVTVTTIVAAGCFLALIGKVNPEGIISLLSGIAGYVLGGYTRRPAERDTEEG